MARPSKNNKPTVTLISPEGDSVQATLLNARDLVQRGYLQEAAVKAAIAAKESGHASAAEVAAKIIAKKENNQEPSTTETSPETPWTLESATTANGFSNADDYLESLESEELHGILKDKLDDKMHHKTGKASLVAQIKSHFS